MVEYEVPQYAKPLPLVTDPDYAPFWEGARRHELLVRRCQECGEYQWPSRPMCSHCHSFDLEWVKVSGKGTLYTYTVANRAFHPAFQGDVPYGVVIVELDEGPRMVGNSEGVAPEDLKIGMTMETAFNDMTEEVTLVNWKPLSTK